MSPSPTSDLQPRWLKTWLGWKAIWLSPLCQVTSAFSLSLEYSRSLGEALIQDLINYCHELHRENQAPEEVGLLLVTALLEYGVMSSGGLGLS